MIGQNPTRGRVRLIDRPEATQIMIGQNPTRGRVRLIDRPEATRLMIGQNPTGGEVRYLSGATPSRTPTPSFTPVASNTPTSTSTFTPPPVPVFSHAAFTYDGDGKRVKSVLTTNLGATTTFFIGAHYEVTHSTGSGQAGTSITKYYFAGSQRIAMRKDGVLSYILGDHLGSTSIVTDASGNVVSQTKYKAWGEVRYSSGTSPTRYGFTGQMDYTGDFGLMFYNARWLDVSLGRFAQADTIVPPGVQGLDRYGYTGNDPVNHTDPSGHCRMDAKADDCLKADRSNAPTFETRFETFFADAERIAKNKGKKDTLEAMARIVESASENFNGNWNEMMKALGMVFLGLPENNGTYSGPGTLYYAEATKNKNPDFPTYFLGRYFKDTRFNRYYQDDNNQVYHVWGYIANTAVVNGDWHAGRIARSESIYANNYHEFTDKTDGSSRQDFLLSRAGIEIGSQITSDTILPNELGDVLRTNLGDSASVDYRFVWQYWLLPDAQP